MSIIKNNIILVGSGIAFLGSIAWGVYEGGFEPWIVMVLSLVGIASNWELLPMPGNKNRQLSPEQRIELRDKWRPVFEDFFLESARKGYRGDAIVHDVDRIDSYPNGPEEKGISAWFRVGLMGTYNDGILLGLRWTYVFQKGEDWIEDPLNKSEECVKVMLLGEVPYEAIESVNFDGDKYYNKPHIFIHFDYNGEPYNRLFYGEGFQLDPGFPHHYREVCEYTPTPASKWLSWMPSRKPKKD